MAKAFASYVVDNDRRFRNALTRISADVKDLRIPLTLIAQDFYKSEKAIFQLQGPGLYPEFKHSDAVYRTTKSGKRVFEGTAGGGESPYQFRKIKKWGFDYPLLKASGKLERSMTDPQDSNAINNIAPDNQTLTIGTLVSYGIFHQSDEPRSKIPLRKFLFIGPEAPQFAYGPTAGRLERWINILKGFYGQKLAAIGAYHVG